MTFERIAIIGAGTMGAGIATSLGQQGRAVSLVDANADAVARALAGAGKFYARAVEKGRMTAAEADAAHANITAVSLENLGDCDLVIEAVFEEFAVKQDLYKRLNAVIDDEVVVATNTSALRVSELAQGVRNPAAFLGLHYFNPAEINPIVEVVKGNATDDAIYARALEFCRRTGKKPIACRDQYGFAINRFFVPYGNEAIRLMDEGIGTPAQIDRVAQDCLGAAGGPFMVTNLVKPKIMYHAQNNLRPLGDFYLPAGSLAEKGDSDYSFDLGEGTEPDTLADAAAGTVADRLRAALFFPVLQALDEDVAAASDIDMGAELALRFARPPCRLMDELGRHEVRRIVALMTEKYNAPMPGALERVGRLRDE